MLPRRRRRRRNLLGRAVGNLNEANAKAAQAANRRAWKRQERKNNCTRHIYIHALEVKLYTQKGWTCSPMAGHHGAEGYWLAVKRS